jgi:hypothetical protein
MKIPKSIEKEIKTVLDMESYKRKLIDSIYDWLDEKGIDTQGSEFYDSIGVRLENAEFEDFDEFKIDLIKFSKGEEVGYG